MLFFKRKSENNRQTLSSLLNIFSQANNHLIGPFSPSTYYPFERKLWRFSVEKNCFKDNGYFRWKKKYCALFYFCRHSYFRGFSFKFGSFLSPFLLFPFLHIFLRCLNFQRAWCGFRIEVLQYSQLTILRPLKLFSSVLHRWDCLIFLLKFFVVLHVLTPSTNIPKCHVSAGNSIFYPFWPWFTSLFLSHTQAHTFFFTVNRMIINCTL